MCGLLVLYVSEKYGHTEPRGLAEETMRTGMVVLLCVAGESFLIYAAVCFLGESMGRLQRARVKSGVSAERARTELR